MRATAKLVNAINNGSISAFVARDGTKSTSSCTQCPQINPMGGLNSDFALDPNTLTFQATSMGWAQGVDGGITGVTVMLPSWVGAKFPSITLDTNLNVVTAPDTAALTKMAAAGYFA